ncbi:MAG: LPS export ABC transporter permease LptF, partial [Halieaceae bacterium]|nr:LPS export ABC transporter permease LptF [Halieaceae bacterium]
MSYGRLYVESEMVILSACGVSPSRLTMYTLVPAMLVMLIVGSLSLFITPLGAARSEALLSNPESRQGLNTLVAGRFQARRSINLVSYAESIAPETGIMHSVFLAGNKKDDDGKYRMIVTVAQEGEIVVDPTTGARYMELRRGSRYEGVPGRLDYRVATFEEFGELIPEPEGGIRTSDPVDGRATVALYNSSSLEDKAALLWRISLPLMVPVVAVIALCLSRTDHRRGRYIKMAPGFVIHLAYLMLLTNARAAIEQGDNGLLANIWLVHLLFFVLALALLFGPGLYNRFKYQRYIRART